MQSLRPFTINFLFYLDSNGIYMQMKWPSQGRRKVFSQRDFNRKFSLPEKADETEEKY